MEEKLLDFLDWITYNVDDIFEVVDNPKEVVKKYLEEN